MILRGHALDLIESLQERPSLIVTDPPYAFGGTGDEHAMSATVATVLRESARRLESGRWDDRDVRGVMAKHVLHGRIRARHRGAGSHCDMVQAERSNQGADNGLGVGQRERGCL